jgi:flagellar motor component MotA
MNCTDLENLKLCLEVDDKVVYEFSDKVNEENIIKAAKHIEELLSKNDANPKKIQDVFELLVEVMQNILNYSHSMVALENNKREAYGVLILSYTSSSDKYILQSCNLIDKEQENIISEKLESLDGLDSKDLRKLAREKMRSREDNHDKGAGLGFIMMARKCTEPIEISFSPFKEDVLQYKLKLII